MDRRALLLGTAAWAATLPGWSQGQEFNRYEPAVKVSGTRVD